MAQLNSEWVCVLDRLPTEADADPYGCVLVWHIWQGVMITGWHQICENRFFSHWKTPPDPPPGYKELRKTWEEEIKLRIKPR